MGTVSLFVVAIVITLLAMLTINAHAQNFSGSSVNQLESPVKVASR
jgi:hypothetical protein